MGKKLGLLSKISNEKMIAQIENLEREDRAKTKGRVILTESGAKSVF